MPTPKALASNILEVMNMPSSLPSSLNTHSMGELQRFGYVASGAAPTVSEYANSIRVRKWLVGTLALLATGMVAAIAMVLPPVYQSSATILIENGKSKVLSFEEIYGVPAGSREFFQTQAEFMRSREVAMRVVTKMGLASNEHFDPRISKPTALQSLLNTALPMLGFEKLETTPHRALTDDEAIELVLAGYKEGLDIVPVRQSQLVEIRFQSTDPFLSAKIANATAEAYITADLDARFNMQQAASKWLNERLEDMRRELERSERALQEFREEIGLVATPASSMGGNVRSLDTSAERLIAARVERAQAEQIFRQVSRNSANRYEVPAVFNNPAVQAARSAEAVAEKRLADAAQTLGPSHPEYRAALAELTTARDNTKRQAEGVIASIAKAYEVARSAERALEEAVSASKGDIRDINRKEGQLNVLERDVATNQQIYQTFLAKVKETDATADFRNPIARIVDAAVPALSPIKPRKAQMILLAALAGTLLGCILAIAIEQRSTVIRSTSEVQERLGLPLLAAVPKVQGKERSGLSRLQHDDPNALFSESIRSVVTGVRLSLISVPKPVIVFASTLPGEGKSTLALNFAIEQARTKRTLLIDADMRKPSIGKLLGISPTGAGLTSVFHGAPLDNCIKHVDALSLSLLLPDQREPNPHDLLMSSRFSEILAQLKQQFESIVIDSPPIELVSDVLPIGLQATGVIYVVSAGTTDAPLARRGIERLQVANIRTLGVVLNFHDFDKAGRYYGEYNAYGAYGKGHYGDPIASKT